MGLLMEGRESAPFSHWKLKRGRLMTRKELESMLILIIGNFLEEMGEIKIQESFWESERRLTEEEATWLIEQFIEKDTKEALNDMKINTSHGLDGLPVSFYRPSMNKLKGQLWKCLGNFIVGI
jgi:hypothetical protein